MEENILKKKKVDEDEKKKRGLLFILGKRVRNGRFLFLLVAFLLTLVGLSASTYAWFTSNFTVSVQEIDVNVSSGSGIQISTNATDWKSLITIEDITTNKYSGAVNQVPTTATQMNPVSTVPTAFAEATTTSTGLKMFRGQIVNSVVDGKMFLNSTQLTDGAAGNNDYIAFDLFLKLDFSGSKKVYLTGGTGITAGNPNTHIEYAGRMAFVVQDHAPSSTSAAGLQALKGSQNIIFLEPNYDVHTANGIQNANNNYPYAVAGGALTETGNASATPYYGVKAAFTYNESDETTGVILGSTDANKFEAVTPTITTAAGNTERTEFLTLQPGVTKIRVYMWIEGQDVDCENNASGGQVKFNLGFTVDENETSQATPTQP